MLPCPCPVVWRRGKMPWSRTDGAATGFKNGGFSLRPAWPPGGWNWPRRMQTTDVTSHARARSCRHPDPRGGDPGDETRRGLEWVQERGKEAALPLPLPASHSHRRRAVPLCLFGLVKNKERESSSSHSGLTCFIRDLNRNTDSANLPSFIFMLWLRLASR